jgi:hypothetical protein
MTPSHGFRVTAVAAFLCAAAALVAAADAEDFPSLVKRLQSQKPEFAKRQQDLLQMRYDLSDRPAKGATMARGKPVQEGVRARLPKGTTWDALAAMSPDEIKGKDL